MITSTGLSSCDPSLIWSILKPQLASQEEPVVQPAEQPGLATQALPVQGPVHITHNYTPALAVMEAGASQAPEVPPHPHRPRLAPEEIIQPATASPERHLSYNSAWV